jgi:hypothetical protein
MPAINDHDQRLIEKIKLGELNFIEEEIDSYSDEVLIAFAGEYAYFLEDLPKDRLSYGVLKAAINKSTPIDPLKHFSSQDTPHYRELALLAVSKSGSQVKFVEPEFVDADFFREAIKQNPKSMHSFLLRYAPLVEQVYTQKELEFIIDSSKLNKHIILTGIMSAKVKNNLLSDAYIKKTILDYPGLIAEAIKSDYKHLAIELLNAGDWPSAQAGDRPSNLKEAVKRLLDSNTETFNEWHKAYILNFGIEKVVDAMKGHKTLPLLEKFFTREEILPHLSGQQGKKAKGKWLEEELGL